MTDINAAFYSAKVKQLNISMLIGILLLLTFLWLGKTALYNYCFSGHTQGVVVDARVTIDRTVRINVSPQQIEKHEMLVEYMVGADAYWLVLNTHAYSALGVFQVGDAVTVSYPTAEPKQGAVVSYALFSTFASIIWPFILLIFFVVTPQWLYARKKLREATE